MDLTGRAGDSKIVSGGPISAQVRAMFTRISGTVTQWEMCLLETLINPMTPYALPGITSYMPAMGSAYEKYAPGDNTVTAPAYTLCLNPFQMPGNYNAAGIPSASGVTQYNSVNNEYEFINPIMSDVHLGARYDQREGLVRGTFTVSEASSKFLIWFDPTDGKNPVWTLGLKDTNDPWCYIDNFDPAFGPQEYTWDRDPWRNTNADWAPVDPFGSGIDVDRSSMVYIGGAALHLAVNTKTAYSDCSMKARNLCDYDRRFYDAPAVGGEYGDATQTQRKVNEAIAVYNGSTWRQRTQVTETLSPAQVAARLTYVIQSGLPLIEVHVVNATTGGAPIGFNFEARLWAGISFHTLKDNATVPFHTVPCTIPPWFSCVRTRGAVSEKRSELASMLIENTVGAIKANPVPRHVAAVVHNALPKSRPTSGTGLEGVLHSVAAAGANALGIDAKDPLPGIANLITSKALPLLASIF